MQRFVFSAIGALWFAGCASTSPLQLDSSHPANPDAPEGAHGASRVSLRADKATLKSRALLSDAQKEQERWDESGPVSGTPERASKTGDKPEIKHEP